MKSLKLLSLIFFLKITSLYGIEESLISIEEYSNQIGNVDPVRQRIPTLNKKGSSYCFNTELTNAFLEHCSHLPKDKAVLEIGCAFGIKSSQIVQTGVLLVANDLDENHLRMMRNTFCLLSKKNPKFSSVQYVAGNILDLELEKFGTKKFASILVESVLHFFTPDEIQHVLKKFNSLLEEKGRVYITVSSPFLKYLADVYRVNKSKGESWPGFFLDPEKINVNNARLHKPYHTFDDETFHRELTIAGFHILESKYIPVPHHEVDMQLDGREGLMVIAEKL